MANCKLAQNILKEDACGYSLLKITDVYLGNYSEITTTLAADCNEISSVTGTFYHIEPSKDSASFTDELQVTDGGAKYRTHTLNFSIDSGSYDCKLAEVIDDLALGRYVAIVKLANGTRVMLGRTTPLEATSANIAGAASASESSAIAVTMTSDTTETVVPVPAEVEVTVYNG